jgi:hypothetical protein
VFSGAFTAKEVDGLADGSGDATMLDAQTLRGLSEPVPEICLFD